MCSGVVFSVVEGVGGGRGELGCCGGRGIGITGISSGKSQSSVAMLSWICCWIAAWSMGSLFGSSVGVVEGDVGGGRVKSSCHGGWVIIIIGIGIEKSQSSIVMLLQICCWIAAWSMGSLFGGCSGVASAGEMLQGLGEHNKGAGVVVIEPGE